MESCKLEIWKKRWFFLASKCSKKLWNSWWQQSWSLKCGTKLLAQCFSPTHQTSEYFLHLGRDFSLVAFCEHEQGDRLLAKVHFQRQRQIKELTNFSNRVFQCGIVQRKFCHITYEITIYNQILNMSDFYRQWHTIWCKNCEFGRKLKAKIWHS